MNITQFYLSIAVGMVINLICEETLGIVCGGAIVAGYLSMVCDDALTMLVVLMIALLDYFIVEFILPKFVILFGKRRFIATLLVSLILKLLADFLVPTLLPFAALTFRGTGVIVPGLLANNCSKQGLHITLPSALLATYLTYGIVQLIMHVL